jgi:hypothetical protein
MLEYNTQINDLIKESIEKGENFDDNLYPLYSPLIPITPASINSPLKQRKKMLFNIFGLTQIDYEVCDDLI